MPIINKRRIKMKNKIFFTAILILAVGICLSWNAFSKTQKENKAMNQENQALNLQLQRALAYQEINNAMAAHTYCYEAGKQSYEIENFWSKRDDISYNQNNTREATINYYVKTNEASHKAKLKKMSELFPGEIKNVPENEGIGDMVVHLLTTPYIEIAGDCATAKGLWYVPSVNVEIDEKGEPVPVTIWEKTEVAFIKEGGKWKIWHFTQWVQFAHQLDKSIVSAMQLSRPFFQPQQGEQQPGKQQAQQTQQNNNDQTYSTKRVSDWRPELPKPYDTYEK
jgi:hypothetical protein